MQRLFDVPEDEPPTARPRWLRLTATLDGDGRVACVETEVVALAGNTVLWRGFWPAPGLVGESEPLRELLKLADRLTRDA